MRKSILSMILVIGFLTGCTAVPPAKVSHYYLTVSLPTIKLAEGERIDLVEVIMDCGRFRAINAIPNDWSAEVVGPSSEVTTLRMEAGHGSSAVWDSREFDGFITIMDCADECFNLKARVHVYLDEAQERTISFNRHELMLTAAPAARRIRP